MANTKILMNTSGKLYTYSGKLMLNVPYVYGDNCPNVVMEHTPKYLNLTIDGTDYDVTDVSWDDGFGYTTHFEGTWNGKYLMTQDSVAPCVFASGTITGVEIWFRSSPSGYEYQYILNSIEVIQQKDGWWSHVDEKCVEVKFSGTQNVFNSDNSLYSSDPLYGNAELAPSTYVDGDISQTAKHSPRIVSKRFGPHGEWYYNNNTYDQDWTIAIQPQWTEPS